MKRIARISPVDGDCNSAHSQRPGISVVPSDPLDPFNLNSAGGSSQFFASVIYVHVNAGVAVVSTECSVAHAMLLMFMPYFVADQLVYLNQPGSRGNTDAKASVGANRGESLSETICQRLFCLRAVDLPTGPHAADVTRAVTKCCENAV
jgi:hypothetical protein